MTQLQVSDQAKVATMAWNTHQHFELHYAIPCTGRIYHTINPKLAAEQIVQIICDAQDEMLIIEPDCIAVIESIYDEIKHVVQYFVVLGDVDPHLKAKFLCTRQK